jgi:hypothetical protein
MLLLILKKEEGASEGDNESRGQEDGCEKEGYHEGFRLGGGILKCEEQV